MIIAVSSTHPLSEGSFPALCISYLAQQYPQQQFLYFFDRPFNEKIISAENIQAKIIGSKSDGPLRWQYWYNFTLPAQLKKHKVDILICADGIGTLRSKIPQYLLPNQDFIDCPQILSRGKLAFFKRFTPKFIQQAAGIITHHAYSKNWLTEKYGLTHDRVTVIPDCIHAMFSAYSEDEKNSVREKYTEGLAYFLFAGTGTTSFEPINLLKAFSFFKKRQKSNMKLLIANKQLALDVNFMKALRSFKFRDEVILLNNYTTEELAGIMSAAYAFVYPVLTDSDAEPVRQSIQCEVPVIATRSRALEESFSDAILYADAKDFNDIAEKMILVFKDEQLRNKLIMHGKQRLIPFNTATNARLLWKLISKANKPETT